MAGTTRPRMTEQGQQRRAACPTELAATRQTEGLSSWSMRSLTASLGDLATMRPGRLLVSMLLAASVEPRESVEREARLV
jgi:hypothetical protein